MKTEIEQAEKAKVEEVLNYIHTIQFVDGHEMRKISDHIRSKFLTKHDDEAL